MILNEQTFWTCYNHGREDNAWDYKQQVNFSDKTGFAKFLKHVLAFSNFRGGYLLLGVGDDRRILGVTEEIDQADLGGKVEADLEFPLDLKLCYFTHHADGYSIRLGLLYIPPSQEILVSKKDFPERNKPIVRKDDVYYRRNTRSIKATAQDYNQCSRELVKIKPRMRWLSKTKQVH